MPTWSGVNGQGKSIEKSCVHSNGYTPFPVEEKPQENKVIVGKTPISQENSTSQVEGKTTPNKLVEKADKKVVQQVIKSEKPSDQTQKKLEDKSQILASEKTTKIVSEVIDVKGEFAIIEKIVNEMYKQVFSKSEKFKPTRSSTLGDLLLFVGAKSQTLGELDNFIKIFGVQIQRDFVREDNGYIPLVLKLTTWLDKRQNTTYSEQVVKGLFNVLSGLVNDLTSPKREILEKVMVKLYNFVKEMGINI